MQKMMENETLEQIVLAKGLELAPVFSVPYKVRAFVYVESHHDRNGFNIERIAPDSERKFSVCRLRAELPADNAEWWIAAKILEIQMGTPLAIRQHYHELREAHDAGFDNFHGITVTKEQSWERFIGDYGKDEIKEPVPFFESQLHELCVALGWQGGTYHQVLAEIKRLKAYESDNREPSHC